MMTYALTMKFVKAGKFKLNDRAVNLLGENALQGIPNAAGMTVQTLLDHTSGLHNFNGADGRDFFADLINDPQRGKRVHSAEELVAYARKPEHGPTGAPGAKTSYSSTGYIVLEMILTRAGKAPLAQLYRDELFVPLGMTTAGVEGVDFTTQQIADSYGIPDPTDTRLSPFAGRKKVRADGLIDLSRGHTYYNAWARGAGAVAASVKDLAKFMDEVDAGRLTVVKSQAAEYRRLRTVRNGKLNWNGGSWGIQASIFSVPARDITVIVLTNASNVGPSSGDIGQQLIAAAVK
jgi:CubicO group peptidase (beta-lactamase class C family)